MTVSPAEYWLSAYEQGHRHYLNRWLHWVCAPLFAASLVGIIWCIPVPRTLAETLPLINWATLFVMAAIVYYFVMSTTLALGILPFVGMTVAGLAWLDASGAPILLLSSAGLLIAATGQFIGHKLEGGSASLLRDLHHAAIAPIWVLAAIYRKLGIPY